MGSQGRGFAAVEELGHGIIRLRRGELSQGRQTLFECHAASRLSGEGKKVRPTRSGLWCGIGGPIGTALDLGRARSRAIRSNGRTLADPSVRFSALTPGAM